MARAGNKIFATLRELGIGFVPYCPVGRGLLTGTINENSRFAQADRRSTLPRFTPEALKKNMPLVALLRDWAQRKNARPAQFALAWILAQYPWVAPIPGTTNPAHLRENIGAVALRLSPAELREFDVALAAIPLEGTAPIPSRKARLTADGCCGAGGRRPLFF